MYLLPKILPVIEIVNTTNSGHRFQIKSKSDAILLTSEEFHSQADLDTALSKLNTLQITRGNFERKTNHQGKFLFDLKDGNGSLIGTSQLYDSEAGMENGIKNLHNRLTDLKKL